ncbi:hypothetical protein ACQ4PT_033482 [Festuca glaucescens]
MVSQHGILLAAGLISDHFGPIVASVTLTPFFLVVVGAGCRAVTLYLAIFDNVLHRLRFSKFLSVIHADIPESEVLIEGLLQNGRLTFDQLVECTISKVPERTTRPEREEIRLNFNKLVYARYVERCPKPEPSFDPDEQPTPARRRVQKTVEEVLSLEQKIVNTATLSDAERFSEIPYNMEDASNANDCPRNAVSGAKIIDTTILDKQIVHSTLYKLWKDDYMDSEIIDTTILDKQIVHSTLYKLWKDDYMDSEVCLIISSE